MEHNERFSDKKLILLYLIRALRLPPTNEQLIRLAAQSGYFDYFELQQGIYELTEGGLLLSLSDSDKKGPFILSGEGSNVLDLFSDRIPTLLQLEIKHFALASRAELLEENQVQAEYEKVNDDEYWVTLRAIEQGMTLFEMRLNIARREQAIELCDAWKKRSGAAYRAFVDALFASDTPGSEDADSEE